MYSSRNDRVYFSKLVQDLEVLMLEVSQHTTDRGESTCLLSPFQPVDTLLPSTRRTLRVSAITALSFALTRLIRTGLLIPPTPSAPLDPRPSFFTPIFPSLLRHLSSVPSSSTQRSMEDRTGSEHRYGVGFWPRLLLELQESDIASLAWSFLLHLSRSIHTTDAKPERAIKRAAEYLERFLGPAVEPLGSRKGKLGEGSNASAVRKTTELYDAFVNSLLVRGKGREAGGEAAVEVRCRIVVGWVAKGGDIGK